jgi:hypothetical protein
MAWLFNAVLLSIVQALCNDSPVGLLVLSTLPEAVLILQIIPEEIPRVNHQYTTYTFVFTHPMVHVRIDVPAEQLRKLVASLRPSDFPIVIRVPLNLPNIPHIHMPDMTYVYISSTTFNIVHNALNRGRNEGYIFSLVVCVECDEWPCHAMTTPHL